jgi:hypothetical protein
MGQSPSLMKRRFLVLLTAATILSCLAAVGNGQGSKKVLKPDREILITSVEHRDTGKPYRVEGQTSGSKTTIYYKLACGTAGADLEVGHVYNAAEITHNGTKALVMGNVGPDGLVISCDVEYVKTTDLPPT